jgi:hypothetical protein
MLSRTLAAIARTSLREPFSTEVPNLWPRLQVALARRGMQHHLGRRLLRRRVAAAAATLAVIGAAGALLPPGTTPTATAVHATTARDDALLDVLVPPSVGPLLMQRQAAVEKAFRGAGADALVTAGHVYTIHNGDVIEGSVQVSLLRPDVERDSSELLSGLRQSLGGGNFSEMHERIPLFDGSCACAGQYREVRVRDEDLRFHQRVWVSVLPDQRIYLWFPPQPRTVEVVVLRGQFPALSADELVLTMSDRQHGAPLVAVPVPPVAAEQPGGPR